MGLAVQLPDLALAGVRTTYGDFCIHAVIDVARTFDERELVRAYEATLEAFPVLGHRYLQGFFRDRWIRVKTPIASGVIVERALDADALERRTEHWVESSLDSTRERQLRVVALEHGHVVRLVLTVMHLAVDGAGVGAVGHVFGCALYGKEPGLPVDQRRDVWRTLRGLSWKHAPVLAFGLAKSLTVPLRQASAAARMVPYAVDRSGAKAIHHEMSIDRETVTSLRKRCDGASVNDILVSAFARVAAERSPSGPAVVTYTIDLRRYGGTPALIAANVSGILSALVPRSALGSIESTTHAVRAITKAHRDELHAPALVLALYGLGATLPHYIARALVRAMSPMLIDLPLSRGLVVTNVGRIDEGLAAFGDDITSLLIVGPRIEGVPVPLVVAYGFRGAVQLSFYAPSGIPKSSLETLERELRRAIL